MLARRPGQRRAVGRGVAPRAAVALRLAVAAGIDGFRFFGLSEVAGIVERATVAGQKELERLDEKYNALVPTDNTLVRAFEAMFEASPESFSPLHTH